MKLVEGRECCQLSEVVEVDRVVKQSEGRSLDLAAREGCSAWSPEAEVDSVGSRSAER